VPPLDFEHAIPGESSRAFRAFLKYRDLGPLRSIDAVAAIDASSADKAKRKHRASGVYGRWSSKNHWVERVAAYDAHVEDVRMRAHIERIQMLERRRAEFEFKNQELLEDRCGKMDAILDKFDSAPITDVTTITDVTKKRTKTQRGSITRTRSKTKGINGAGYSAIVRQRNDTARQAIVGVRLVDESKDPGDKAVDGLVWERREPK
jgi:hypothetical protein